MGLLWCVGKIIIVYCRDELFMHPFERYTGVYFPRLFRNSGNITLVSAEIVLHPISYIILYECYASTATRISDTNKSPMLITQIELLSVIC